MDAPSEEPHSGLFALPADGRSGQPRADTRGCGDVAFPLVEKEGLIGMLLRFLLRAREAPNFGQGEKSLRVAIERVGLRDEVERVARQPLRVLEVASSRDQLRLDRLPRQGCV